MNQGSGISSIAVSLTKVTKFIQTNAVFIFFSSGKPSTNDSICGSFVCSSTLTILEKGYLS